MNKPNYAPLSTIIFTILFAASIYFAKEFHENIVLIVSTITNHLEIAFFIFIIIEHSLMSGVIVSLLACKKKGLHNLKNISKGGIIFGLFFCGIGGGIIGLTFGLIYWGIIGGVFWGILLLICFEIVGGIVGSINEFRKTAN